MKQGEAWSDQSSSHQDGCASKQQQVGSKPFITSEREQRARRVTKWRVHHARDFQEVFDELSHEVHERAMPVGLEVVLGAIGVHHVHALEEAQEVLLVALCLPGEFDLQQVLSVAEAQPVDKSPGLSRLGPTGRWRHS
jgi:hypothetical protein